ncbi:phosphodiester glycosidase family protein [Halocynthiibacter sp. C4]|uniref:phosphodiester glycosidase family protein n=1 Tax=Halocynthiibacter sp. C4 TaxID=2992758 RepID=UPI00237A142B|nr:phosphodiester glycosidase family protein [Halocynthiibacter sp. C4]MDE0591107.1 phosphodiester glycosidase family protein [Halocynthiibacter sp. C4]
MIRSLSFLLGFLAVITGHSAAAQCAVEEFEGNAYTVCRADAEDDLRLFLRNDENRILGGFSAVNAALKPEGKALVFAMNAGMYHSNRMPVGLFVENGEELTPVSHGGGVGNFGLTPNGVFCISDGRVDVIETTVFEAAKPDCRFASQSGPMLVIDGELHPRFIPNGDSRYYRNGVGTSADGKTAIFAISNQQVNFHDFGRFFRDHIKVPNALFFDGKVSRLYAPEVGRRDIGLPIGPIVGLVTDR